VNCNGRGKLSEAQSDQSFFGADGGAQKMRRKKNLGSTKEKGRIRLPHRDSLER
jgi:hypothetical protein